MFNRDAIGTDDIQTLRYNKSTIYIVDIAIAGRTAEAYNIDQASAGAGHANTAGFLINFLTSHARLRPAIVLQQQLVSMQRSN